MDPIESNSDDEFTGLFDKFVNTACRALGTGTLLEIKSRLFTHFKGQRIRATHWAPH